MIPDSGVLSQAKRIRWKLPIGLIALFSPTIGFVAMADHPEPLSIDTYQLGLLRKGPTWSPERNAVVDSLQAGHMRNIERMAEEGVLVGAGPFLDGGDPRGIFIFRADSTAVVRELAERDPAIHSERLVLDLYTFHAPAGIGDGYRLRKARGLRDSMVRMQLGSVKRGPTWSTDRSPESVRMFEAHEESMLKLMETGTLALAGRVAGGGDLVGLFFFRADSATARKLLDQDPAIRAGALKVELRPWMTAYGAMPGDSL